MPVILASVRLSWALLTRSSRRRYALIVLAQMATGLLDLIGVALIGLMGLAATAAVSGSTTTLAALPGFDRWEGKDPAQLAVVLAAAAAVALLARSLAYGLLLRVNYRLLSRCQTEATGLLLARYLQRPITDIQATASQATAYALTAGAGAAITGLLGSLSVILTDSALLVLLGLGLLALSPVITLAAIAYLGALLLVVHFSLSRWSARNGRDLGRTGVSTVIDVQQGIGLYRELWALGRLGRQYEQTRSGLESAAYARGTLTLIGQIPKVAYDAALVFGALLLVAWELRVSTLTEAMATLLVFLAAASRVIPSLLRVNGQLIQMRSYCGQARQTYDLAAKLDTPAPAGWRAPSLAPAGAIARSDGPTGGHVVVRNVTYGYPGGQGPVLVDVCLDVPAGTSMAIVGPTGGGKSTLADVIVGLLVPDAGGVEIDGMRPLELITGSPGVLAYVPQRVVLVDGCVRENVAVAIDPAQVDDERVWEALRQAHVGDVVAELPGGLDARIGEHGLRLSGGQRQRIGLARALYSRPSLLILDEATSALDAETEQAIAEGIAGLRGTVTIIVIAHRLAAVKEADHVVYLDGGRVAGEGTFGDLVERSESFARQVEILSLPRPHADVTGG